MPLSRVFVVIAFFISLAACGGGGGGTNGNAGNNAGATAPTIPTMLTGQVLVPNGIVASLTQPSIADIALNLVFPQALADLNGIVPAPAGTVVELVRLNSLAEVSAILATTTTGSNGRYSFDLSILRLSPSITLAVQVRDSVSTVILRAFISGSSVDISPESEVIFREIRDAVINTTPLANFTITEVSTLVRSLRNLSTNAEELVGADLNSTIEIIRGILSNNEEIVRYRDASFSPGQVPDGARFNNYLRLDIGASYTYFGELTVTLDGETRSGDYINSTIIDSTIDVDGITVTRFSSSNFLGVGPDDAYYANTLDGILDYTDIVEGLTNSPIPILLLPFSNGQDLVIDESLVAGAQVFNVSYQSFPISTLEVPFGIFNDVIHTKAVAKSIINGDEISIDYYFVKNIGLIRQDISIIEDGNTVIATEVLTNILGLNDISLIDDVEISIELNQGFDATVPTYTAEVGFDVDTVSLSVTAAESDTRVTINNTGGTLRPENLRRISLLPGENRIEINLSSGSQTRNATYVITVTRLPSPPLLSTLELSVDLDQVFQSNQFNYSSQVSFMVNSININASSFNVSDEVAVNGIPVNTGISLALNEGDNVIAVVVSNAIQSSTYTIFVNRQTADSFAQQSYIKGSNLNSGELFGTSVAIDGDTLAVGAPNDDSAGSNVGAVYVFNRESGVWRESAVLSPSNPDFFDQFGSSVSVNGELMVIGAPGEDSSASGVNSDQDNNEFDSAGAAYVYRFSEGEWRQEAYIKASNTGSDDRFGEKVSVFENTIAISAPREDGSDSGINVNQIGSDSLDTLNSGAVYIFRYENTQWVQEAYIKPSNTEFSGAFGASIDLNQSTLVVGAPDETSGSRGINGSQNNNGASSSGAAYVFVYRDNEWVQQAYIKSSNTDSFDLFGFSISIYNDTLAVGARDEASNAVGINGNQDDNSSFLSGAVYVFHRIGDSWSQESYIKSSNSEESDRFSQSLALEGDLLAVGAIFEDGAGRGINVNRGTGAFRSGGTYVFERSNGLWRQISYVKASNADPNDLFGSALDISNGTIVSTAIEEESTSNQIDGDETDNSGIRVGAAYVFQ